MTAHFILYVQDQRISRDFYARVLGSEPMLDVPGMTEFALGDGCVLGLMPEAGIVNLLGAAIPDPSLAHGVPRSELYLLMDDAGPTIGTLRELGARELSQPTVRDWGHRVAYYLDPDEHILAIAEAG
jgi:catechol 2,3-dioxygenase-like lactoylglutathione lyase family enzyme